VEEFLSTQETISFFRRIQRHEVKIFMLSYSRRGIRKFLKEQNIQITMLTLRLGLIFPVCSWFTLAKTLEAAEEGGLEDCCIYFIKSSPNFE
jgi:hypothetical protein